MRRYRAGSGAPWETKVGYSRVVRTGAHVVVTGTTSFVEGGDPVTGDAFAQATQIFRNVAIALARVGATLDDVVRTRIFVTDIARDWEAVGRAHANAVGHVRPATTMVQVSALIEPWMTVEIEVDAIVGAEAPIDAPGVEIGVGSRDDVRRLLEEATLPFPGDEEPVAFRVARRDGEVVACVGWERHGADALLRSLVVTNTERGKGVGTLLVDVACRRLADAQAIWLFTFDAEDFFARFGFEVVPRDGLAASLQGSKELAQCETATPMRRPT